MAKVTITTCLVCGERIYEPRLIKLQNWRANLEDELCESCAINCTITFDKLGVEYEYEPVRKLVNRELMIEQVQKGYLRLI